jgi:hypothetical protein
VHHALPGRQAGVLVVVQGAAVSNSHHLLVILISFHSADDVEHKQQYMSSNMAMQLTIIAHCCAAALQASVHAWLIRHVPSS